MNDVAMPISPKSDQASTTDAGKTTSWTVRLTRSPGRIEGASISIGGTSGTGLIASAGAGAGAASQRGALVFRSRGRGGRPDALREIRSDAWRRARVAWLC